MLCWTPEGLYVGLSIGESKRIEKIMEDAEHFNCGCRQTGGEEWGRDCGGTCHNDCRNNHHFIAMMIVCSVGTSSQHITARDPLRCTNIGKSTICSTEAERSPYLPTMVLYRGLPGIQHRKGSVSPGTTACRRLDWDKARCALLTRTSYIILEYRESPIRRTTFLEDDNGTHIRL